MSELVELLDRLSRLATPPLLGALTASALMIVLVRNWRIALPALIVQYVLVGIMLARAIDAGVALVKPLAGALVCVALSIAAQYADAQRAQRGESVALDRIRRVTWHSLPAQVLLRAVAAVIVLIAAFGAAVRFPLPGDARELGLGAYILIGCGILLIGTATEVLNVGIGLLVFLSGVELAYTPLEPSVSVSVLLGLMTLLVGVAIAYLTLADGSALIEPDSPTPGQGATRLGRLRQVLAQRQHRSLEVASQPQPPDSNSAPALVE
ncbi:MAG: hypothetical protein RMN25_09465 [Anaerolineae bacterium]|nr:hypothetical protein [Thermoflexales bacterium]MDW8407998.1 hypothetical protein [Anaerolineae bacterium]